MYFVWDILKPRIQVSWLWIHFPSRQMFHSDWFSITLCGGRCGQLSLGALGLPCMAACDRHLLRATYFTYNLCSGRSCLFYLLLCCPFWTSETQTFCLHLIVLSSTTCSPFDVKSTSNNKLWTWHSQHFVSDFYCFFITSDCLKFFLLWSDTVHRPSYSRAVHPVCCGSYSFLAYPELLEKTQNLLPIWDKEKTKRNFQISSWLFFNAAYRSSVNGFNTFKCIYL